MADREVGRKIQTSTTFNISSIGKLFTQMAIEQLVDAGRIDLDAPIAKYWPDYPNADVARRVTIRQLLAHRSGIGGDIFQKDRLATLRHNRDYLPLFVDMPLRFEPGSQEEYSNAGYVVLGELIARVSGEDYYDYLQRHIFDPAGMRSTAYHRRDTLPASAAAGYSRMVVAGRRPDPEAPLARNGSNVSAGGSPGSNAVIAEGLPGGYDLIVLSNFDPPAARTIGDAVENWLLPAGTRVDSDAAPAAPPVANWKGFPTTPAGKAAEAYMQAFNSGDPAAIRALLENQAVPNPKRTIEQRVESYRSMFAQHGKLTPVGIQRATDFELEMFVDGASTGAILLIVNVEPAAPHRIASIGLRISR